MDAHRLRIRLLAWLLSVIITLSSVFAMAAESTLPATVDAGVEAPLIIGHRTLHVFRATLGEFSPEERAAAAEQRVVQAFDAGGEGWTSVKPTPHGFLVLIDDKPMFTVVRGDARDALGETPEDLANTASRRLQTAWREAQEKSDPRAILRAALKVTLAAIALIVCLFVIIRIARLLRSWITNDWGQRIESLHAGRLGEKVASFLPLVASRATIIAAWLTSLFVVFVFLTYGLGQFVATRPISEQLTGSLVRLMNGMLGAAGAAIPGFFVSIVIFLIAWIATQVSTQLFQHVESSKMRLGMLDHHTAPATRRIANASIWLFAAAMAYPYLPGSHTEAFKGLTVIMGLMVSIGASGLVGQIASGVILVYTRAVGLGEYVKVQDCQGTVTELGLFVTRLRTGMGEEIALPNALVLSSVIHNFSRAAKGRGFVLDATVTIGYDTPWRQVHAMLLAAAGHIPSILRDPAPYVMQTALSDFYVEYRLVVYADSDQPAARARIASDLNANIQDEFNRHGVQIMSPHYRFDPQQPKVVPEAQWYTAPAVMPPSDTPPK